MREMTSLIRNRLLGKVPSAQDRPNQVEIMKKDKKNVWKNLGTSAASGAVDAAIPAVKEGFSSFWKSFKERKKTRARKVA